MSGERPLLCVMAPSFELAGTVVESGAGWQAESAEEVVEVLRRLLADRDALRVAGARALGLQQRWFSRSRVLSAYLELFGLPTGSTRIAQRHRAV
jgi:hypothetical protein